MDEIRRGWVMLDITNQLMQPVTIPAIFFIILILVILFIGMIFGVGMILSSFKKADAIDMEKWHEHSRNRREKEKHKGHARNRKF